MLTIFCDDRREFPFRSLCVEEIEIAFDAIKLYVRQTQVRFSITMYIYVVKKELDMMPLRLAFYSEL